VGDEGFFEEQMPPVRGGESESHLSLKCPETPEEETGDSEQQMATQQRGNNTGESTVNIAERGKLGTLAYKINCKWGN